MDAAQIALELQRYQFDTSTEETLQRGVAQVLQKLPLSYLREERLTPNDRIDFLVGKVGVELKTQGGRTPLLRQLARYAQSDRINEVLVVTARATHKLPPSVGGKPVHVLVLRPGI